MLQTKSRHHCKQTIIEVLAQTKDNNITGNNATETPKIYHEKGDQNHATSLHSREGLTPRRSFYKGCPCQHPASVPNTHLL